MNITIKNDFATVICQILGAELLSYKDSNGKEYMWQKDPAYWAKTSPVLFPWIGATNEAVLINGTPYALPRHGFVKDADFEVAKQGEDYVILATRTNEFTRSVYPFEFVFTVTFRLNGSALEITYGVENEGTENMPFLIGGHPAFFCPMEDGAEFTDYILHFEDADKEDLPLQYHLFDNDAILYEHFTTRSVKLLHKTSGKGLQFDFPGYDTVAFWTPINKNAPFLCLEPWCNGAPEQTNVCMNLSEKTYVQTLAAGTKRDYPFSFRPC
ncbi:MAG: aldose 1-epimerase family protein [Eubacteriales bacterium]|nr:aldose 1-epimerase family protein [Eubacteriales bacterium]